MGPINLSKKNKSLDWKKHYRRLMDIQHNRSIMRNEGKYTSFDTLIEFVKTQKIPLFERRSFE